jgi:hypothetical protein
MTAPYAGAPVTQKFRERWLNVARQVGSNKPVASVQIRRGRLNRTYHQYPGLGYPTFGEYPGVLGIGFWYPDWQVNSDWMDLEGVLNIKLDQSFDQNGVQTCTISMDNVALIETTGHAGMLYHIVEKGYYSPLRGYVAPKRPDPGVKKTPFFNQLPNAQIRIMQGYGEDEMVCTFLGLIDDIESTSVGGQLTITARDFGGVLVDERFFGWAQEKFLPSPLTFAPRVLAENSKLVGGGGRASSTIAGYDAANVTSRGGAGWRSIVHRSPAHTEWVEITVPVSKFSQMFVGFPMEGMDCFVGIKPQAPPPTNIEGEGGLTNPRFNGEDMILDGDGWWNPNGDIVPGVAGGWPYFEEIPATKVGPPSYMNLGGAFEVGDGTILRLGFRDLGAATVSSDGALLGGGYQAGVDYLQVNARSYKQNAIAGRYVIIDDVADIIRCVLRWCGFKGWEVENTGTNLRMPYVADSAKTFMDVVKVVTDMTGYVFFMGEPRDPENDQDLGYPIFRNARALEPHTAKTEFIDDKLLLTDAKVKVSNADDHCIIRCRGKAKNDGVALGGDQVLRIMFAYIPPWAAEQGGHVAGVLKPLTHFDHLFTTVDECEFGCYLIALQVAMLKYTAIVDLPGNPGIGLDTLQSVIDRTQGLNSRLYVSNRTQEMQFGNNGYWHLEIGGSLIDTQDFVGVMKDYKAAILRIDRGRHDPWLRKRHGKVLDYGYQAS